MSLLTKEDLRCAGWSYVDSVCKWTNAYYKRVGYTLLQALAVELQVLSQMDKVHELRSRGWVILASDPLQQIGEGKQILVKSCSDSKTTWGLDGGYDHMKRVARLEERFYE